MTVALGATPGEPAPVPGGEIVWHVETLDGNQVESRRGDEPINPASVVKVATSLWALETLGPEHRFWTRIGLRGALDPQTGVLEGDLVVLGGGDPDFHVENAYLVAVALNRAGLREVRGSLVVDERFWIGWEGGRTGADPGRRARSMAARLRDTLDSARWSKDTRRAMQRFRTRRGLTGEAVPSVAVRGGSGADVGGEPPRVVVVHRSNPLRVTLKRMNAYSNNDIERLGTGLGAPADLAQFLALRWKQAGATPAFETCCGLGSNRMTCREIVHLLRDLGQTCERMGLGIGDILPVAGCDPGTLSHYPRLGGKDIAGSVVAKSGTLITTDGGVAVLAGSASTAEGGRLFCAASPRSGTAVHDARQSHERHILDLLTREGGALPNSCGADVVFSDTDAQVDIQAATEVGSAIEVESAAGATVPF